jgi:hypothetical protein
MSWAYSFFFVCGLMYNMYFCCLLSHFHVFCSLLCFDCFIFFNYFYVYFLVLYVLLSILCVLCFCIVLCIVYPHVCSCLFSICVRFTDYCLWVETQLQLINMISYHIILLPSKCAHSVFSVSIATIHILF